MNVFNTGICLRGEDCAGDLFQPVGQPLPLKNSCHCKNFTIGSIDSPGRFSPALCGSFPLVKAVGGYDTSIVLKRVCKTGLLMNRFGAGVDEQAAGNPFVCMFGGI